MKKTIDLNSDLGEGFGIYRIGNDEEILKLVSSANIACGWHGGDPLIMDKTVSLAISNGVAIGAHPSYPDPLGFGRRNMDISLEEARAYILYQLGALQAFAHAHGSRINHIKLHGAFYNASAKDGDLAKVIIESACKVDPSIYFLCLSGSLFAEIAKREGVNVAQEVFADRAYNDDGSLVSRSKEGALITNDKEAILRTIQMVKSSRVKTIEGNEIPIAADSICVHGDNPKALVLVKKIHQALEEEGIEIAPIGRE